MPGRLLGLRSPWPRLWLGWVGRSAGMRVRVAGTPLASHVLFVSNHLSWLDIMLIAGASGAAFVSKGDVARWPVFGWLAGLNNTIFVDRAERGAVHGQADALRTALVGGQPVALFPEGTTEGGEQVLPFRASLLAVALAAAARRAAAADRDRLWRRGRRHRLGRRRSRGSQCQEGAVAARARRG